MFNKSIIECCIFSRFNVFCKITKMKEIQYYYKILYTFYYLKMIATMLENVKPANINKMVGIDEHKLKEMLKGQFELWKNNKRIFGS